ncbi:hypothetical protein HMPREF9969_0798 [Prevotella sp. oral taxon 306 str. F0472]|nr:hypothetical protein HMPREF9969_0798 [Prevotella sp. oral taxon 306 str. F0472]
MTYQVNEVLQRIIEFFASFCTLSLVNPNNLLTHTHTHTHTQYAHLAYNNTFFLLAYARAKRAVTPVNKGLLGVSFVCFFMPFCELRFKQNKNEITAILIKKVMRKEQTKRDYSAPECMIIQVNEATNLMQTSFPSQHKKAHKATGPAAAKASQWNDEDLEDETTSSWED